jgi:hypothetical protein
LNWRCQTRATTPPSLATLAQPSPITTTCPHMTHHRSPIAMAMARL